MNKLTEYLEKLNKKNELELYKIAIGEDGIILNKIPKFRLVDLDNDGRKDIGLIHITKERYDTVKASYIYLLIK